MPTVQWTANCGCNGRRDGTVGFRRTAMHSGTSIERPTPMLEAIEHTRLTGHAVELMCVVRPTEEELANAKA